MATSPLHRVVEQLRRDSLVLEGSRQSDAALLEGFLMRRDGGDFEALVRRYGPMVLGVCRRILQDRHSAEDAFQAAFMVLIQKAASLGKREHLANWLYGVALRTALQVRRQTIRRRILERKVMEMAVAKDARVVIDGKAAKLSDLKTGMRVTLQMSAEPEQSLIVGVIKE